MKIPRLLITLAVFIAVGAGIGLAVVRLTGGGTGGYLVRATFENSSFVSPGEDVKIAGVRVGTIQAVQLTPHNQAALVLHITDRQFVPFRADAHCAIGLESLLGEQFVQCTPTQPRPAGAPPPPALQTIGAGPNQGQHVLPVQNTTTPVGLDLLQNITRLPQQERLRLIITGLGASLDANGQRLNAALQRADPALEQTDQVIAVLARQDRVLADLTDESARILQPLAAQRSYLGGFIRHAGAVAVASARESSSIQRGLQDFPAFLRQLKPYSARLTNLSEQMTPALQTLQSYAPQINTSVVDLGPLSSAAVPALRTLGNVAQRGETVFPRAHRVAQQLLALGKPLLPLARDIAAVATSFDNTGGIEDVMRFIYYYAGSVNGEDKFGHFVRAMLTPAVPLVRSSTPASGTSTANFTCEFHSGHCKVRAGTAGFGVLQAAYPQLISQGSKKPSNAKQDARQTRAANGRPDPNSRSMSAPSTASLGGLVTNARALLGYLLSP